MHRYPAPPPDAEVVADLLELSSRPSKGLYVSGDLVSIEHELSNHSPVSVCIGWTRRLSIDSRDHEAVVAPTQPAENREWLLPPGLQPIRWTNGRRLSVWRKHLENSQTPSLSSCVRCSAMEAEITVWRLQRHRILFGVIRLQAPPMRFPVVPDGENAD